MTNPFLDVSRVKELLVKILASTEFESQGADGHLRSDQEIELLSFIRKCASEAVRILEKA